MMLASAGCAVALVAVLAATPPALVSATIAGANITLNYNEALNLGSVPSTTAFTPSGGKTVTGVSISGATVSLSINSAYSVGVPVTLTYVPGANPIQDVYGNNAAGFTGQAIDIGDGVESIAWTSLSNATASASSVTATAANSAAFGIATKRIPAFVDGSVQFTVANTSHTTGLAFDVDTADPGGTSKYTSYNITFYQNLGSIAYAQGATLTTISGVTVANGTILKMARVGSSVVLSTSTDGTNFTTRATLTVSGITDSTVLYVKAHIFENGSTLSNAKIQNGVTY